LGLFIILTGWSLWSERQERLPSRLFLVALLIGGVLLASTAWRGAENVYRHGLGVMSLPQAEGESHSDHNEELEHGQSHVVIQDQNNAEQLEDKNTGHANGHHDSHQH